VSSGVFDQTRQTVCLFVSRDAVVSWDPVNLSWNALDEKSLLPLIDRTC